MKTDRDIRDAVNLMNEMKLRGIKRDQIFAMFLDVEHGEDTIPWIEDR